MGGKCFDREGKFKDRVKPYAYISYIGGVYATGCVNTLVMHHTKNVKPLTNIHDN